MTQSTLAQTPPAATYQVYGYRWAILLCFMLAVIFNGWTAAALLTGYAAYLITALLLFGPG